MYSTEFHKAGTEYVDANGAKQKYANDYNKITSVIPVKSNVFNAEYAKGIVKKELFATSEEV